MKAPGKNKTDAQRMNVSASDRKRQKYGELVVGEASSLILLRLCKETNVRMKIVMVSSKLLGGCSAKRLGVSNNRHTEGLMSNAED
jgi:hypothetical protein